MTVLESQTSMTDGGLELLVDYVLGRKLQNILFSSEQERGMGITHTVPLRLVA